MLFTDGRGYTIPSLPADVFEEWMADESRGGYFNDHIRGRY